MMNRLAVFPGTFDPFTIGHESIVKRALPLFDKIIIAIGENINKESFFSLEKRLEWMHEVFENELCVEIQTYKGLTINFCKKIGASYLIRGLRTSADFEYERAIGQVNKSLGQEVESIFLLTNPEYSFINSSIIRDIIRNGGDATKFLPHSNKMIQYIKTL